MKCIGCANAVYCRLEKEAPSKEIEDMLAKWEAAIQGATEAITVYNGDAVCLYHFKTRARGTSLPGRGW